MADISTTTKTITKHRNVPRSGPPRLAIGASLKAVADFLVDAFSMAYVDPYTRPHRHPQIATDDDLEGRDPNW